MEPRIQYAKTSDGVNIAYWTLGDGPPFVHMPNFPVSHIQAEWRDPDRRRWYERLAEWRMLVRFDHRGTGLSSGETREASVEALSLDVEAVADSLGLKSFALLGYLASGPAAINYAVSRPERLSHLILWHTWARPLQGMTSPAQNSLAELAVKDWETFTETFAHAALGWDEGEAAHRFAAFMRDAVTPEVFFAGFAAVSGFDATALAPRVSVPTLVCDRPEARSSPGESAARELASAIPGAHLVLLEGQSVAPFLGDTDALLKAMREFLGDTSQSAERARASSGTAIILFADIADSTGLTERLGDTAFREKARALDGGLRDVIRGAGGTPVEGRLLGDGVLAVFTSARAAIEAALACGKAGDEAGLPLHLGLHAGDVNEEDGNVFGGAVNIAARVAGESASGELLVSQTVRDLARTSADVSFEDAGERTLKGVADGVRVWRVRQA